MKPLKFALVLTVLAVCLSGAPITYVADLTGAAEVPPNASPGTGHAIVTVDDIANLLTVDVVFSGLLAPTTASHIHCCTLVAGTGNAGVATTVPYFTGFPIGVMAGTYIHTFDLTLMSSYNPAFVTAHGGTAAGAEAFLVAGIADGTSYLNIHTTMFPRGEIRGYLVPAPEPSTVAVTGIGLVALLLALKRKSA